MNWRTGQVIEKFTVPADTHDVDHLTGSQYAVADKSHHRAYVYDSNRDIILWEYNFSDHFPPSAGGGSPDSYAGDYTHLNDIDAVDNGSAFLLSPRNFDRILLVSRDTEETVWSLGEENNYEILHEQHNPVLLTSDPPTVLVADSENNRIVEYQLQGGGSRLVWEYRDDLIWPRDADRLPNGNTLIVDTGNDRVIEATPDRKIVWDISTDRAPYDVERLQYGDEPSGPSMNTYNDHFDTPQDQNPQTGIIGGTVSALYDSYNHIFQYAAWILPSWLSRTEFSFLLASISLVISWGYIEIANRFRFDQIDPLVWARQIRKPISRLIGGGVLFVIGGGLATIGIKDIFVSINLNDPVFVSLGGILLLVGVSNCFSTFRDRSIMIRSTSLSLKQLVRLILIIPTLVTALVVGGVGVIKVSRIEFANLYFALAVLLLYTWGYGFEDIGQYHPLRVRNMETIIGGIMIAFGMIVSALSGLQFNLSIIYATVGLTVVIGGVDLISNALRQKPVYEQTVPRFFDCLIFGLVVIGFVLIVVIGGVIMVNLLSSGFSGNNDTLWLNVGLSLVIFFQIDNIFSTKGNERS